MPLDLSLIKAAAIKAEDWGSEKEAELHEVRVALNHKEASLDHMRRQRDRLKHDVRRVKLQNLILGWLVFLAAVAYFVWFALS